MVGAGPGGLTCAAYLAANGKRVLVLEANQVVGGSTQVFRRAGNKFEFDVGTHYVGECGPGGRMQTALSGLALTERIKWLRQRPEGHCQIMIPGTTFQTPTGWDTYLDRLVAAFPEEEAGLRRCVRIMRTVAAGERPLLRPFALLRWGVRPITTLMAACGLSADAQAVILAENGDYTWPPHRTPTAMHAGFLHHYLQAGAYYPRGGGQVIGAHLTDVIQTHGGRVRTKARVEQILIEDGRAVGVRLRGGEEIRSEVVVSAADFKKTWAELVGDEHLTRRLRRQAEGPGDDAADVRGVRRARRRPARTRHSAARLGVADQRRRRLLPRGRRWSLPRADAGGHQLPHGQGPRGDALGARRATRRSSS